MRKSPELYDDFMTPEEYEYQEMLKTAARQKCLERMDKEQREFVNEILSAVVMLSERGIEDDMEDKICTDKNGNQSIRKISTPRKNLIRDGVFLSTKKWAAG